jgi:hypothetical protein
MRGLTLVRAHYDENRLARMRDNRNLLARVRYDRNLIPVPEPRFRWFVTRPISCV